LMDIVTEFLSKILANQIEWHIEKMILYEKVGLVCGMQKWFHMHKLIWNNTAHKWNKTQKLYDDFNRCRKKLWQYSTFLQLQTKQE
jgi:hypothetical protein